MTKIASAKDDGLIAAALRKEIAAAKDAGITLGSICKGSGVDVPVLSRYMARKRSLTLLTADKLANYFGLVVAPPSKRAKKK